MQEQLNKLENVQKGLKLKLQGRQAQLEAADAAEQKASRDRKRPAAAGPASGSGTEHGGLPVQQ